jgi:TolB-like protein
VAVLPFEDMSERKDQQYFADGMAEEIINLLSGVPDLRVPARTSSFYFKGKHKYHRTTNLPTSSMTAGISTA